MHKIRKILVANRGEIAVRIIRAAKEMGIGTVAVYSEVDRVAVHVTKADEVYELSNRGIEPYLDMDQILDAAELAGVDAIHPGYGFLSENAVFATETERRGFIFIGPGAEAIRTMGDKLKAKELAIRAGLPVIPGFAVNAVEDDDLVRRSAEIGFPVLIKARAGGGGKGMRIAHEAAEIRDEIVVAMREAQEAFGDGSVFVEKLIHKPRHIEIQVLADQAGNAVHLFERECSIQRRHQKVIEEAPSSFLSSDIRKQMGDAALRLVQLCNYTNAGTLEFIMDQDQHFYFLEMNTRLQVEHPVTEFITGVDIVKQQIKIAQGGLLELRQNMLGISGHAIELRVYAEDPQNSFLPDIGKLEKYIPPKGIGVRVDDGYEQGMLIPVEYDPLIAKLIVFGEDRNEAIARMIRAVEEYELDGVRNTLAFGAWVMEDPGFVDGNFDTSFVESKLEQFATGIFDEEEASMASLVASQFMDEISAGVRKNPPILQKSWRNRRPM